MGWFHPNIKKILKTSKMKMVDEVANQSDKLEKKITAQTEKINSQQESLQTQITAQSEKFETLKQEIKAQQQSLMQELVEMLSEHNLKI